MADPPILAALELTASAAEAVVDHDTRVALGLTHWVDGTMGFDRRGGRETVIAPNGPRLARHRLDLGGFADGLQARDIEIEGGGWRPDHASGGPLFRDEATGRLLLVYHGEYFAAGDPTDFYAYIGLAASDDDGTSFTDLGAIITSELAEDDPARPHPLEVGAGAYAICDGWFLVFTQERGAQPRYHRRNLLVARARVDDVLAATRRGRAPAFTKYHDGAFSQPGLGGLASEVLPSGSDPVLWCDAAWIEPIQQVLLVYSTVVPMPDGTHEWNHAAAVSPDGVHWSPSTRLYPATTKDELIYLTIDSGGPDQRCITGSTFDVYRVRSAAPYRWDDAVLERVSVTWSAPEPGGRAGA